MKKYRENGCRQSACQRDRHRQAESSQEVPPVGGKAGGCLPGGTAGPGQAAGKGQGPHAEEQTQQAEGGSSRQIAERGTAKAQRALPRQKGKGADARGNPLEKEEGRA